MSATYTEIKRITGNNKGFAAAALAKLIATCDWITGDEGMTVYLRNKSNDWVAILDVYAGEGTEFTSVGGKNVILVDNGSYIGIEAE